ncbi:hypothetical protein DesfrDRAFT_0151 [Solidesulfovibrio fructosivorans JJ]]|uniref:Uncharacterized protein n=1 Tax=Solidesulfovibrio fructosivorans JJ] TaxID=596151 RepID=E1JRA2_SOLFR|nr:hypothetical protein [Solidesulfovibrio fructosivorans]EFL53103.1 hypothetical protein DesfrDRAFT_0151 [Solidesulfovibrio fructosivorans JJ]]
MVTAREQFAADILAALPHLSGFQPAEYRPKEGDPVETYAMVTDAALENDGRVYGEYAAIRVPMAHVPAPSADDCIAIGGEVWEFRVNQGAKLRRERRFPFWVLQCRLKGSVGVGGRS